MQIHELDNFIGTPSDSTYLAIDDGTETNKIPATDLGVTTEMTLTEAETGTETAPRVITPAVLNLFVRSAPYVIEEGNSGIWHYRKWSNGRTEAWASYSFISASWNAWVAPIRYMDKTLNFPSGLFSSTPTMVASSASNQYWVVDAYASDATQGTMRLATVSQTAMATSARIYAWTN